MMIDDVNRRSYASATATVGARSSPATSPVSAGARSRRGYFAALAVLVVLAGALRLHGLFHDLPFSYYGDELHLVKRAMAMGAGDFNPHWFNKPALLMYMLLACYGAFFAVGAAIGKFDAAEEFGAYFLTDIGPFLLIGRLLVAAFGVGTVVVAYLIGRKAFRSEASGFAAALICAVLLPAVVGAQTVKEDVPAGFFLALAAYSYLFTRDNSRLAPLFCAAFFAGLSMGTKFYGLAALPVFCVAELARHYSDGWPWRRSIGRAALLVAVFVASFFLASPYHFLDPTFARRVIDLLSPFFGGATVTVYDPDNAIVYERGFGSAPGAIVHFIGKLVRIHALSGPLSALAAVGLVVAIRSREARWPALILAGPVFMFMALAVTVAAYHTNARHLIAIFPLVAVFAYPGALLLARMARIPERACAPAALLIVALAAVPTTIESVRQNLHIMRFDSRVVAHDWIIQNIAPESRILLDEDGPILQQNSASIARQEDLLRQIGSNHPFTRHQGQRLDLLKRYPSGRGFNIDELGHQWWLNREATDEELRTSRKHFNMGNPLISRKPKSIAEYRAAGYRYIVTNSMIQVRYQTEPAASAFPSFARLYRDLARRSPLKTFDPIEWGGKGPVVWIYDLEATE